MPRYAVWDDRREPPRRTFLLVALALIVGCALVPVDEAGHVSPTSLRFRDAHVPYLQGEVLFSHEDHTFAECSDCHFGTTEDGSGAIALPAMARCFECHDGDTAPRDCSTCHIENRYRRKPRFHTGQWPRQHRRMAEDEAYKCALCHVQDECQACHSIRRPMSHTPRFLRSTHGRMATHDRSSCSTCHRSEFCENCHSQPPPDHTPIFMGIIEPDGTVRAGHRQAALLRGRSCLTCHSFERTCQRCHG